MVKLSQAIKHAYQRLTQAGLGHYKVTNYSIGLNLILFCTVYFISNTFISLMFALVILVFAMKFVDDKKAFE